MSAAVAPVGRRYELPALPVGRRQLREFAAVVDERGPECHRTAAARVLGYPDIVAPPTFVAAVALRLDWLILADPVVGGTGSGVLQRSRHIAHRRPVVAGDVLVCRATITRAETVRGGTVLTVEHRVTAAGVDICATTTDLVIVGGESR